MIATLANWSNCFSLTGGVTTNVWAIIDQKTIFIKSDSAQWLSNYKHSTNDKCLCYGMMRRLSCPGIWSASRGYAVYRPLNAQLAALLAYGTTPSARNSPGPASSIDTQCWRAVQASITPWCWGLIAEAARPWALASDMSEWDRFGIMKPC